MNAADVIRMLDLKPLEGEGGLYRQTWFDGNVCRPAATAIYYLVTASSFSSLHRLADSEMFHFYAGDPCQMVWVEPDGNLVTQVLGTDLASGARPQVLVPALAWQGTKLTEGGEWALLGTTMTPGFRPDTFELAPPGFLDGFDTEKRNLLAPYMPSPRW